MIKISRGLKLFFILSFLFLTPHSSLLTPALASSLLPLPEGTQPNISENIQKQESSTNAAGGEDGIDQTQNINSNNAEESSYAVDQSSTPPSEQKSSSKIWLVILSLGLAIVLIFGGYKMYKKK
jgi:hypothetical protein